MIKTLSLNAITILEALVAIAVGLFLCLGMACLVGNMTSMSVSYEVFGQRFVTGPDDRFMNSLFFMVPAMILVLLFMFLNFLESLVKKDLEIG